MMRPALIASTLLLATGVYVYFGVYNEQRAVPLGDGTNKMLSVHWQQGYIVPQ